MSLNSQDAVRLVLKEAAQHDHSCGFSDGERLNWMIARAFQIGKEQNHDSSNHRRNLEIADSGELKHERSKPIRRPRRRPSAKRRRPP
jgi:hypothetical protein